MYIDSLTQLSRAIDAAFEAAMVPGLLLLAAPIAVGCASGAIRSNWALSRICLDQTSLSVDGADRFMRRAHFWKSASNATSRSNVSRETGPEIRQSSSKDAPVTPRPCPVRARHCGYARR